MPEPRTTARLTRDGAVATIALVPPEGKPPTLDTGVFDALEEALGALEADPPRLAVLRSTTDRYFCVGANLNVLRTLDARTIGPWVERGHAVLNRLEDLPCPVLARVAGYALGGGLELALASDVLYADASARLGLTEARLGFIPGWGGTRRLAERVGPRAAGQLFFAGRIVDGPEAARLGVVDHLADAGALDAAVDAYAAEVAETSRAAVATFKRMLADGRRAARERTRTAEAAHSVACLRDPEARQRLDAFLARKA